MANTFEQLGPYKLGQKLGQGGMGTVFEAIDTETGQAVAVKVLSPALATEEGLRGRFEAEIESLKKLKHPNIVRLFGYGEQDGTMFYAMERVDGISLEEEVRQGRRFDWREVTHIAIRLCRALKHAHDHGIIHRDLKPANILMARDGEIKLSDFGIARLFGNTRMTSDGGVLGTAEYMAPEQADGRPVTDRCDQYSLGGVMFTLLAGRPPFRASSFVEMLQMQRFSEPQPVSRFAPDTPAELDRIIAQLLEKDPVRRFSNANMLARSLEAMEKGLSVSSARDDFVINDPQRTHQPHLTGLDPYAATLVPSGEPAAPGTRSVTGVQGGTAVHTGQTVEPERASSAVAPATRFTKVQEEAAAPSAWYDELVQVLFTPQSLGLVVALAVMAAGAWYLLQPLSADQLYHRTVELAGDGELDDLRKAEPDINLFLERFPGDPRAAEIEAYKQQLTLARKARQAKLFGRTPGYRQDTSPIERAYLEATQLIPTDPAAAAARMQAIVDLYGSEDMQNAPGAEFVAIARQELETLQERVAAETAEQQHLLEGRAEKARHLEKANPAEARRIWAAIDKLYGDKPWAAKVVEEAREALR